MAEVAASPSAPAPPQDGPDGPLRPVVLVGMMGSGKTTVGRRLAARLDRPFVDADDELARRTGRTVRQWFAEEGEEGFRRAEADLLADLLAGPGPVVIAAGGGVVVRPENRAALARSARVAYLRASAPFLVSRMKHKPHRPLLDDDPEATLVRLLAERSALYEGVADLAVDVEPFHSQHDRPKRALAQRLAEMVEAAEAAGSEGAAGGGAS